MNSIPEFVSKKFKCWSFLTILTVVMAHSYNLNIRYLQPWTTPNEPLTITSFSELFIANGLVRFTMPLLFIISGYLYAFKDDQPNNIRIKKRFKSLLIPYFIWSAAGLALVYSLELFPYTKSMVKATNIAWMNEHQVFLHQYHWYEVIARWIFAPVSYQLWFIWVLFFYNLGYKFILRCVMHPKGKWIFFSVATFLWLSTFGAVILEGEGLLFFSLGVWIQKNKFNIEAPSKWLNPIWWGLTSLSLITIKTWFAFKGMPLLGNGIYPILALLLKLSVFSGLIAAWYGSNALVTFLMNQKWFTAASNYAFFIYLAHAPLVAIGIDSIFSLLHYTTGYRFISFLLWPFMLIIGFIIIGFIIHKISSRFFSFITGGGCINYFPLFYVIDINLFYD